MKVAKKFLLPVGLVAALMSQAAQADTSQTAGGQALSPQAAGNAGTYQTASSSQYNSSSTTSSRYGNNQSANNYAGNNGYGYGNTAHWDGWYAGISGDLTWLRNSDTGGGGNLDLGYRFWPNNWGGDIRAEAEIGYHEAPGTNGAGDTSYFTYMGNLYYDFPQWNYGSWNLVPYAGAGIGDATVHFGESGTNAFNHTFGSFSDSDNVFAYQFMAGLSWIPQAAPNTSWSLGYRYLGSDRDNFLDNAGNSGSDRLRSNNLELAYRYNF